MRQGEKPKGHPGGKIQLLLLYTEEISMQNYIGVKIVKAEPQENEGQPGYKVKYPDGYVSWSPKETFEKSYRKLDCEDFINREE